MAMSQTDIQRRSTILRGVKPKAFTMHLADIDLIERLANALGETQLDTVLRAVRELAQRQGVPLPSEEERAAFTELSRQTRPVPDKTAGERRGRPVR